MVRYHHENSSPHKHPLPPSEVARSNAQWAEANGISYLCHPDTIVPFDILQLRNTSGLESSYSSRSTLLYPRYGQGRCPLVLRSSLHVILLPSFVFSTDKPIHSPPAQNTRELSVLSCPDISVGIGAAATFMRPPGEELEYPLAEKQAYLVNHLQVTRPPLSISVESQTRVYLKSPAHGAGNIERFVNGRIMILFNVVIAASKKWFPHLACPGAASQDGCQG